MRRKLHIICIPILGAAITKVWNSLVKRVRIKSALTQHILRNAFVPPLGSKPAQTFFCEKKYCFVLLLCRPYIPGSIISTFSPSPLPASRTPSSPALPVMLSAICYSQGKEQRKHLFNEIMKFSHSARGILKLTNGNFVLV